MKTLFTTAICSSLLLLSACNDQANTQQANTETVTLKTEKTALAAGIEKANIDQSVRPQDDMYLHTNGAWLKTHEIPADKNAIGSFYDLRDKADEDVRSIIEELAKRNDLKPGTDEQKVADIFRSFMNTELLNQLGLKPIEPLLADVDAIKNLDDLARYIGKRQADGVETPLAFYIDIDDKDATKYAMSMWQSGLGLPDRDYYFNDGERFQKLRDGYVKHIANMFKLAGIADADAAAQRVMALETKLAQYHWTRVANRDSEKRYNKIAKDKLTELAPHFNWSQFFAAVGDDTSKENYLIVNQPDFVQGFDKVLAETDLADWKTYFKFHTLSSFASYLSADFDQENFDFYGKQLSGSEEQRPRWKRGVAVANRSLGEVIGKVYVSRFFKPEAKARMSELVENLRTAYSKSIDELDWMSETTKKAAQEKLAAFTPKIGYPDRWEDYSSLEIKADDLVGNIIRSRVVSHQKQLAKLGDEIHKWEWGMTPQTVNAYYNPTMNEIVFPAAILQPPFFNMAADDAVNYGGIGAVIGHEMGHGFDDQGSRYDAHGNLRNWWTEQDLAEFKKRTKALVEQYSQYQVFDDLHVNGELTLGENIGDLSGVTIAYKAYKASLNGKEAPVIDGLTGDERFFYGFAQIWRNKIREESLRNRVATDPHSPGHFRAIGSLSNMPEFYQTFNVKPGDKMYIAPEKRVKIW